MNFEIFILDGYGQFVWPAFIFTFVSCLFLFTKTKRELQKYEKLFISEYQQPIFAKSITPQKIDGNKEILSRSSF